MTAAPTGPTAPRATLPGPLVRRRRKTLLLVGVLALVIGVYVLPAYTGLNPTTSRVAVSNLAPWHYAALLVHIFPAVIALVVGPLQFSAVLRRHRRIHRAIGRVYVGSVVLASLGGAVVGALSAAGPTAWVGFVLLDVLWATITIAGWRAARAHRYADHAVWLTRSYALTFAGVTLRVWYILLILALQPLLGSWFHGDGNLLMSQAYLVTPWISWVPNLIIGETLVARLRRQLANPRPRIAVAARNGPTPLDTAPTA